MTLALDAAAADEPPLLTSTRVLVHAGHSIPAAALKDPQLAAWVHSHGVSVTARDDHDLDLVRQHKVRVVQVVYRCGTSTAALHRAVALGVSRFVVSTAQHMAQIADHASATKYLSLDDQAPLMLGDKRLKVIGLHTEVNDCDQATEWACAAERIVSRSAVLKACGSTIKRITLSGGSTQFWLASDAAQAGIIEAVGQAVREQCDHWHLPCPAVTLAALTVAHGADPGIRSSAHRRR
ncbi:hypothetical protein [Mycolicibacterium mengxianglii]|uniref:hypothetical protein n=1 Tax=Mycolicibacterium mengxianglii TaxID=2736649 RepID=UPI0018EEDC92|nr:hypothetical protein [Mycolicibacterium mengxianglii]